MLPLREGLKTEMGTITLQTAKRKKLANYDVIDIDGEYVFTQTDGSLAVTSMPGIIRFELTPLSDNRLELIARCRIPSARPYFSELIAKILHRWPEARDASDKEAASKKVLKNPKGVDGKDKMQRSNGSQDVSEPWMKVDDIGDDRQIAKYLHAGFSPFEIAQKLEQRSKTINNKVSILRKRYGKEIIPYFQRWRNKDK